jgi:hypothetical protein
MRSQLFGFIVKPQLMWECQLNCSQQQATTVMIQQLVELGAIVPTIPAHQSRIIHYLADPLTCAIEAYLCEWDEEVNETVHAITSTQALTNERLRMEELKRALSWLWPKVRETAVLGQFVLATAIDETLLMTITFGWNEGASTEDIEMASTFMPLLLRKLKLLGYEATPLTEPLVSAKNTAAPPPVSAVYGPRIETLNKLRDLIQYRQDNMTRKAVHVNRLASIRTLELAPPTVKKYAPLLYERWYDPAYEGGIH